MQIAARTAVYGTDSKSMGRIVFLAEASNHIQAMIIDFRVIETPLEAFPDLQGAILVLDINQDEMPRVEQDGVLIAYFGGEASQFHETDAAEYYVRLCQESCKGSSGS